jgi:hypothetical protein
MGFEVYSFGASGDDHVPGDALLIGGTIGMPSLPATATGGASNEDAEYS